MKIAKLTRYEVRASFSTIGSSFRLAAMLGSAVAITVESVFSMKSAVATVRGTIQNGLWVAAGITLQTHRAPRRLHGSVTTSHPRVSRLYPSCNRPCAADRGHLFR